MSDVDRMEADPAALAEADVPGDVRDRVDTWNAHLAELRRRQGLWSTGPDGEPVWLAPDPGSGAPQGLAATPERRGAQNRGDNRE